MLGGVRNSIQSSGYPELSSSYFHEINPPAIGVPPFCHRMPEGFPHWALPNGSWPSTRRSPSRHVAELEVGGESRWKLQFSNLETNKKTKWIKKMLKFKENQKNVQYRSIEFSPEIELTFCKCSFCILFANGMIPSNMLVEHRKLESDQP